MSKRFSNLTYFLHSTRSKEYNNSELISKQARLDELRELLKEVADTPEVFSSGESFRDSLSALRDLVKGRTSGELRSLRDIVDNEMDSPSLSKLKRLIENTYDSDNQQAPVTEAVQEEVSSYKPSTNRVSAQGLYSDLMAGIGNKNLCIAMVANAIGESNLYVNANGDCGDYAKNRGIDTSKYPDVFRKPERGRCCSFGLWQYNICGGLGISLLEEYGASKESSDPEKYEIITDYRKQLDFMIKHVQKKFNVSENKSIDEWVELFVYKVERPADKPGATARRQEIARGLALA